MKRSLRKAVAFLMAVAMLAGSFNVSAFATETDQTKSSSVTTLAETVYDEAVTFSDSVAFLQNGHWSDENGENVTKDTTIVFMDAQGNKTELKNNDGNGNQLFDAIYPMISDGYHQFDAFKVVKDGKMSYIRTDASHPYYGTSLQWYTYAMPLSDEYVVVSDDNTTYRVLNADGTVVLDNLTNFSHGSVIGNCVYLKCGYAVHMIYGDDQVRSYDRFDDEWYTFQNLGNGYAMVDAEEYTVLLDKDGKIVKSFQMVGNLEGEGALKVRNLYVDAIETGYVVRLVENILSSTSSIYYYDVYNLNTESVVTKCKFLPEFDGSVILGINDDGTRFMVSVDGTKYYENLDTYVTENLVTNSYEAVTYSFYYVNGSLLISMRDEADGVEAETYVLTKDTAFADSAKKHVDGIVDVISFDEEYVLTCDNDWAVSTMIQINGNVVKEYEAGTYGYANRMVKVYSDETRYIYDEIDGFPFRVSVLDPASGYSLGHSYITEDGEVHGARELGQSKGNFIVDYSISGEGVRVINTDNKVVYENDDAEFGCIGMFWYQDYFTVTLDGRVYLYDRDGNLVLGADAEYAAIGNDNIRGTYPAHEKDYYGTYDYFNETLENGICIVKVKSGNTYKYGAVFVGSSIEDGLHYDESDGNWYYYVGGKIATDYTGLVAHNGAWYYVENGVLNWGYTGLTCYNGTWYYVEGGILNWGYTGLTNYGGTWYYVEGGILNWGYTGLTNYGGTWYYVEGGVLNWGYTGLTEYFGTWYYVEGGILNWGYTGLVNHYGTWYYVEGGILNWGYTGLTNYGGTWYYVEGGILNWGYTGLTNYGGTWYYVEGGVLNWGYTGLVNHYGTWYYVGGGVLDWSFTGVVEYGGTLWYVENGVLVGAA